MTFRTRHLATGILAAALMLAPVACSDDDGDDAGSVVNQDETTTTLAEDIDEEPEGTDGPDGIGTDEGTDGTDVTTETVVTPPEAVAFCDKLESMSDADPEGLEEIRDTFGELDDVVPDEIREPYDSLMNTLSSVSSEEELDQNEQAADDLMVVAGYAMSNCNM